MNEGKRALKQGRGTERNVEVLDSKPDGKETGNYEE